MQVELVSLNDSTSEITHRRTRSLCLAAAQRARSQILQGGRPTTQTGTPQSRQGRKHAGTQRTLKESPQLCFRQGIGWQRASDRNSVALSHPARTRRSDIETNSSAAGGESKSVYAKPASAKPTRSYDCPETSMDTITPTAGVGDITTGNHGQRRLRPA